MLGRLPSELFLKFFEITYVQEKEYKTDISGLSSGSPSLLSSPCALTDYLVLAHLLYTRICVRAM
jgi:hypothetical protein